MEAALKALEPLRAGLIPVPGTPQNGVCTTCKSSVDNTDYSTCFNCGNRFTLLSDVLPISMAVEGGLLHKHLREYKDSPADLTAKWATRRLAALVAVFLEHHQRCLGDWDMVAAVPSQQRRAPAAIVDLVIQLRESPQVHLEAHAVKQYSVPSVDDVSGKRVLVFDDTFTKGASLQGAILALQSAGAIVVGPLVVGRYVKPTFGNTAELLEWLSKRTWDETRCCRCGGEFRSEGSLPLA